MGQLWRWSDRLRQRAERQRLPQAQAAGRRGEDLAHRYLEERGLQVVARNWMPPGQHCEIDLVARDGEQVVFVEVKSRSSTEYGDPERNLDRIKQIAMRRGAFWFMKVHEVPETAVRFDLVTVVLAEPPRVEHYPGHHSLEGTRKGGIVRAANRVY